jgi:hypothetical protein
MHNLQHQTQELREAIDECVRRHLVIPSLILIYATIDVCAWLVYDDSQVGVRFEKWCNSHLLLGTNVTATGADLYGARCGILHTFSAESRKSVTGVAREVVYGWGTADHDKLQEITDLAKHPGYVAVQLEDLRDALFNALDTLVENAKRSPELAERAGKWLAYQSEKDADELLKMVKSLRGDA